MTEREKYPWATKGDINAFCALFLDNVVNLFFLTSILTVFFGMRKEFVFTRILPGTTAGVMLGDLLFTPGSHFDSPTGRTATM